MKRIIIMLMLVVASATASIAASNEAKEYPVKQSDITRLVVDKTTNTNGKEVTKYYVIYKGYLISTSKNVHDKITLCKKHNAKCALKLVVKGNSKRIALD